MRKIGLPVSRTSLDAPLASHFGKAKWLLVYENEETFEFIRNDGLNARAVLESFQEAGCTDLIVHHVGEGAKGHLRESGLKVWQGAAEVPVRELLARLDRNELQPSARSLGLFQLKGPIGIN